MGDGKKGLFELVVVLALVGFGLWYLDKPAIPVAPVTSTISSGGAQVNTGTPNAGALTPLTYAQALVKYKDARIQLNPACQASPASATFKNNTTVMIDNRSDKIRTVKLGSTFTVDVYGFKLVKLWSATLPATWYMNCDSSKNVATFLIQK